MMSILHFLVWASLLGFAFCCGKTSGGNHLDGDGDGILLVQIPFIGLVRDGGGARASIYG